MKLGIAVVAIACVLTLGGCGKSRKEREEEAERLEQQQHATEVQRTAAEEQRRVAQQNAAAKAAVDQQAQEDAELVAKFQGYVKAMLKDPQSAQFADVHLNADKDALCGRVNSKNGFGGYAGFADFVATESGPVRGVNAYIASDSDLVGILYNDVAKKKGCID